MIVKAIADLARPFSLYIVSLGFATGMVLAFVAVLLRREIDLAAAAAFFTPIGLTLGGMYGAKSYEEANKVKHQSQAEASIAQSASTTNAAN